MADIPQAVDDAKRSDEFVWLCLVDPDEDSINEARETLGIHPIAAADVLSGRQQTEGAEVRRAPLHPVVEHHAR